VLLTALALLSAAYWVALAVVGLKTVRGVPEPAAAEDRSSWPKLSLVVPARDEAATIDAALRSKLAEDYPNLEVVFVNDRSTDDTGAIAERLATTESRLRVAHVKELPEGWLGKVHAMQRGLEQASGEWVLFSDADVVLAPGTLRRVVAQAEREGLDHVSMLPRIEAKGALIVPALAAFFRVVILGGRTWQVADPKSSAAAGVGAFNLVRRAALDKSPGLEWLKMEIGDDMALGVMLKRSGARSRIFSGLRTVSLEFYPSYGAMARAVEKNGVAAPFGVMVFANAFLVFIESGFLLGPWPPAAAVWGLSVVVSAGLGRWSGLPLWPALFAPVGMLLLAVAMMRSAVLALVRGGVRWRGTFYPTKVVRAGGRIGFTPKA
jgi:Glycosyl transferase family 2